MVRLEAVIRLRVPGVLEYRDLAIRTVAAACKLAYDEQRKPDEFDEQVVSAFGEAFNNIAIHAYQARAMVGDVDIEVDMQPDRVVITLTDYGDSFDPSSVPAPDLDALPEGGLGLFIINSFMDDVTYRAGKPNVLRLTKYLTDKESRDASNRQVE